MHANKGRACFGDADAAAERLSQPGVVESADDAFLYSDRAG